MQKDLFCLTSSGNVDLIIHISWMLRKPADRLGKVVFANEVSIGGVGGEVAQVHRNLDIGW